MGVPDLRGAKVSQGDAKSKSDVLKILRQAGAKIEPESKRKEKWDTGDVRLIALRPECKQC